jgi:hypothetical protein
MEESTYTCNNPAIPLKGDALNSKAETRKGEGEVISVNNFEIFLWV